MNIIAQPSPIDFEPAEIWSSKPPKRGDHIRVCRMNRLYYHHGIFVSADEVIHFTGDDDDGVLDWSRAHVIKTDLQKFLRGGTVEVKEYTDAELADLYPVEGIVNYARTCLGDGGYNLIFNNCEHFANVCTLGKYRSRQVENFFGGKTMGLWDSIKSFFGFGSSSSRSSSSYNYNYEPDKVRVAEIERDTKLKLADKEAERLELMRDAQLELLKAQTLSQVAIEKARADVAEIERDTKLRLADKEAERLELMRDAQLELLKAQTLSQVAIEKARADGMTVVANQLVVLQEKMLDVARKRIVIIAEASLPIIREIEKFYGEVGAKISAANDEYSIKKLPQLLNILRQYEAGSREYEIFSAQINDDRLRQGKFIEQQMAHVSERQNLVLQSFLSAREKILEQTGQITQTVAEKYLSAAQASVQALPHAEVGALSSDKKTCPD